MSELFPTDPYRVRLDPFERWGIVLLSAGSALWCGIAAFALHTSTKPWLAGLAFFAAPVICYIALRPFLNAHYRRIARLASEHRNMVCPRCHYPMKTETIRLVRCNDCGFQGEARLVEEAWRAYRRVRAEG